MLFSTLPLNHIGTTGDQIVIDFRGADVVQGQTAKMTATVELSFNIAAVDQIERIEILRNSKVIETITPKLSSTNHKGAFSDKAFDKKDVLYYYIRVTQKNKHLGWSSPIWFEA